MLMTSRDVAQVYSDTKDTLWCMMLEGLWGQNTDKEGMTWEWNDLGGGGQSSMALNIFFDLLSIYFVTWLTFYTILNFHNSYCFRCIFNIIDVCATVPPLAVILIVRLTGSFRDEIDTSDALFYSVFILASLGVFRVFRLFKFVRHYDSVSILYLALKVICLTFCKSMFSQVGRPLIFESEKIRL